MQINWDEVRKLLPIYAYEYDVHTETGIEHTYWYPHATENRFRPVPKGWSRIEYEESYENLQKALERYLAGQRAEVVKEKAVWYNNASGSFSDTFDYSLDSDMMKHKMFATENGWRLIIYRCGTDETFEFNNMMKIVTNEDNFRSKVKKK